MSGAIPPASWPSTKRAVCLEYPDTPEWTALVSGVIELLAFGYYWNQDYDNWEDARNAGQEIYQSWQAQIRCDAGAVPVDEGTCVDFPNNSPALDWQPANPFLEPGKIPPGYVAQPWGVVPDPPVFPYQPGDVISGLFGLPVLTPALGQGLARVRIKCTGSGTVEVHLIKVALGGIALITWDDNPFTARFVDTSMDFLAIPPESGDEDIQEVSFDTPGQHHIDVTMLPRFGAEVGFAGYGGGIRKVVLCGFDAINEQTGVEFQMEDDLGSLCEAMRWQDGKLQVFCCGEWTDVPGTATGGAGQAVEQPTQAEPLTPGGCADYDVVLQAGGRWLLPNPVSGGDVVSITNVSGAWNDGTLLWFCPQGYSYVAGLCASAIPAASGDPLQAVGHMRLIAGMDDSAPQYADAFQSVIVVPSGLSDVNLWFQANDSALAGNAGTITFHVQVCKSASSGSGGTDESDFTSSDGGWSIRAGHAGSYSAGNGWDGGCDTVGLDSYLQCIIEKTVVNAGRIKKVTVTFNRTYGGFNDGATGGYAAKNFSEGGGGVAIGSSSSMATGTGTVEIYSANPVDVIAGDVLTVGIVAGYLHARGDCSSFGSGAVRITDVAVEWETADPF